MNQYNESVGRGLEIIVGIISVIITLIFSALLLLLIAKFTIQIASAIIGSILTLAIYWLGQISFRLIFNKRRLDGGLFSIGGLKFWCVFFGVTSIITAATSMYMGLIVQTICSISLLAGCLYGWRIAESRKHKNTYKA